jgi:uncharacterized protein with von Willebrand factor type A (vWA) domain
VAELVRQDPETRFILVGDASMAPYELMAADGAIYLDKRGGYGLKQARRSSIDNLRFIADTFSHAIWLNPVPERMWDYTQTISLIRRVFPMFELSLDGLEQAVTHLMAK